LLTKKMHECHAHVAQGLTKNCSWPPSSAAEFTILLPDRPTTVKPRGNVIEYPILLCHPASFGLRRLWLQKRGQHRWLCL
jgi:hypothetical protein